MQTMGLRSWFIVPKQEKYHWKEKAGMILCQYLTQPKVMQKIWNNAPTNFDVPSIIGVKPKTQSQPFLDMGTYASLTIAIPWGYDAQAGDDYRNLRYEYFAKKVDLDEYLKLMSESHRKCLIRLAERNPKQINHELIKKN